MSFYRKNELSESGFTLIELLVSVAIVSIMMLGLFQLLLSLHRKRVNEQTATKLEKGFIEMDNTISSILSQGIRLYLVQPTEIDNLNNNPLDGGIIHYNHDYSLINPRTDLEADVVAVFAREVGVNSLSNSSMQTPDETFSQFAGSGIFFLPPSESEAGKLIVDIGNNPTGSVFPDDNDFIMDGVVDFRVKKIFTNQYVDSSLVNVPEENITYSDRVLAHGINFEITTRKFKENSPIAYCKTAFLVDNPCNGFTAEELYYQDQVYEFTVDIRNNRVFREGSEGGFNLGSIYFFRPVKPIEKLGE